MKKAAAPFDLTESAQHEEQERERERERERENEKADGRAPARDRDEVVKSVGAIENYTGIGFTSGRFSRADVPALIRALCPHNAAISRQS